MEYVIHVTINEGESFLNDDSVEEVVDFLRSCVGFQEKRIVIRPLSEVISC